MASFGLFVSINRQVTYFWHIFVRRHLILTPWVNQYGSVAWSWELHRHKMFVLFGKIFCYIIVHIHRVLASLRSWCFYCLNLNRNRTRKLFMLITWFPQKSLQQSKFSAISLTSKLGPYVILKYKILFFHLTNLYNKFGRL